MPDALVKIVGLSKSYSHSLVLDEVNFDLYPGEIVGLLGPNGAGKSTLIKIIGGSVTGDDGVMRLGDEDIDLRLHSARGAMECGVVSVYQELSLCANLTVAENFFLSQHHRSRSWRRKAEVLAASTLDEVFPGAGISVHQQVKSLTLAEQQMVEIARGVAALDLKILILDEPTSALSRERIAELHSHLKLLRERGVGIIYVSHKLDEVLAIVDRVTILRGGKNHWSSSVAGFSHDDLVERLGGKSSDGYRVPGKVERSGLPVLMCNRINTSQLKDVSVIVYPGEVVGVAGLDSAGQRALLHEIYSPSRKSRNAVDLRGKVAYVTGDRQAEGLFYQWGVSRNIVVGALRSISPWGIVKKPKADEKIRQWSARLKLPNDRDGALVGSLSGGNQQRVLIARGFASESELLLFDDPMRGVDASTKSDFYALLRELREAGNCALLYSTEDSEFLYCDRVYVMHGGSVQKELRDDDVSVENVIQWSFDSRRHTASKSLPDSE